MKELRGKTGGLALCLPLVGGRTEAGVWSHIRAIVWVRGEIFKAESEIADLWQPKWNENETVLAAAIHTPDRDAEFGDCGVIPGWGLLLIEERLIKGMRGRRLWWEMPVEESQAAVEVRWFCWVTQRECSQHHSLSLSTGQHWQLNNREAGPSTTWHTDLQSRTSPRVPLCAWWAKQYRRTPGKIAL